MDSAELILKNLSLMAEVFGKTMSNNLLDAYYGALKDEPSSAIQQATKDWIRTGTRFPYPADLIGLIKKQATVTPQERTA